jgi:hypothetical protein
MHIKFTDLQKSERTYLQNEQYLPIHIREGPLMFEDNPCCASRITTPMPENIVTFLFSNQTIYARGHKFDNPIHLHIHSPA